MRDLLDDYNMLPSGVVFRDNLFVPVGSVLQPEYGIAPHIAPASHVTSCIGCGACDFKRGQCTYCGRHA